MYGISTQLLKNAHLSYWGEIFNIFLAKSTSFDTESSLISHILVSSHCTFSARTRQLRSGSDHLSINLCIWIYADVLQIHLEPSLQIFEELLVVRLHDLMCELPHIFGMCSKQSGSIWVVDLIKPSQESRSSFETAYLEACF